MRSYYDEVNCILNDSFKDCRNECFHSFDHRCVNDIEVINVQNNEEVSFPITFGYLKLKSQFFGLSKKKSKMQETMVL